MLVFVNTVLFVYISSKSLLKFLSYFFVKKYLLVGA